jgi:hypothetical protein
MQTQLRARLLADPAITVPDASISWGQRAQGSALPAITLNIISDRRDQHMGGFQTTRGTWVQFDIYADGSPAEAQLTMSTLREAIIDLIATAATQGGVTFLSATGINPRDVPATATGTGPVHQAQVEAIIWHTVIS